MAIGYNTIFFFILAEAQRSYIEHSLHSVVWLIGVSFPPPTLLHDLLVLAYSILWSTIIFTHLLPYILSFPSLKHTM